MSQIKNRTVIAFDYGTKSIGSAIGQEITATARPLKAFKANDGIPNWDEIKRLLDEWKPDLILVGLPLNIDGTEQPFTLRAKKFAQRLHGRFGYSVELHDERLSTVDVKSTLFEQYGYQGLQKGNVDNHSAALILESWFEQHYT